MGQFPQKMKIVSSFSHPHFVPNCMSFFLLLNTNKDIFKNIDNQTVAGSQCLP